MSEFDLPSSVDEIGIDLTPRSRIGHLRNYTNHSLYHLPGVSKPHMRQKPKSK